MLKTQLIAVGTSVPESQFTQKEIAELMGISSSKSQRFFEHEHIKTRHLILPKDSSKNKFEEEGPAKLRQKFLTHAVDLIEKSLINMLNGTQYKLSDIDYLVCVTSTAFIVPGLSALVMEKLNFRSDCQRLDVVGMGCNAGLNGLNSVVQWSHTHPEKIAVLICCELCSCIYSLENTENAAIVNSLFGDGIASCLIQTTAQHALAPQIIDFHSHLIGHTLTHLRFDWCEEKNKHSFYVDKKTPVALALEIEVPLKRLLEKNQINQSDIKHWIVHSGGAAILDGIEEKLKLDPQSFRHTRTVLKKYGNVSSGSFLFSYENLQKEKSIRSGDWGVFVTMGPGLTIEMALLKW